MSLGGEDGRAGGTERRRAGLAGYFLAATFARLGARTASMAILLLALERTDSAVVAGIVGGAMAVPSLALAPAVGTLIDRSPSPRVYFSLGFALFGGSILLVDLALTPTTWPFAVAAAAMSGVAMPLIEGAMSPLVARVTTEATLPRGYAVDVATYNTSSIFGAVVASAVTAAWGASAAMSVAAGMPVVAIAALLLVPMSRRPTRAERDGRRLRARDFASGFVLIARIPKLRGSTVAATLSSLGKDSALPLMLALMLVDSGRPASEVGLLMSIHAAGGLAGSIIVTVWPIRLRHAERVLYTMLALSGVLLSFLHVVPEFAWCAALLAVTGLLTGPLTTSTILLRSALTPPSHRTVVFTTAMSLRSTSSVGAVVGGSIGQFAGLLGLVAFVAGSQLVAAATGLLLRNGSAPDEPGIS